MQDPEQLNGPLNDLAENLRALQPAAACTSQRDIWYQAGVEAGRRRAITWRAASVVLAITTAGLLSWNLRPGPAPIQQIVYVRPQPQAAPPHVAATPDAYARLRDAILQKGLDGLPPPDFAAGGEPLPRGEYPRFAPEEIAPPHLSANPRG